MDQINAAEYKTAPGEGEPGPVFISHASKDLKIAQTVCLALEARGIKCWLAQRDVGPGQNYQTAIVEAITRSRALVLIFSRNADNSDEIKKEISLAARMKRAILPVRTEDVMPSGAFSYELSIRQWVDLFQDWENAIAALATQIEGLSVSKSTPNFLGPNRSRKRYYALFAGLAVIAGLVAVGWGVVSYLNSPLRYPDGEPETADGRMTQFRLRVLIGSEPRFRTWRRLTPETWSETYDEGGEFLFNVVKRIRLDDCSGTVVADRMARAKYVFIPDRDCRGLPFLLSIDSPDWSAAGAISEPS